MDETFSLGNAFIYIFPISTILWDISKIPYCAVYRVGTVYVVVDQNHDCQPSVVSQLLFLQNGDTALHIASALKRRKIAKLLVESGVDLNIRNKVWLLSLIFHHRIISV